MEVRELRLCSWTLYQNSQSPTPPCRLKPALSQGLVDSVSHDARELGASEQWTCFGPGGTPAEPRAQAAASRRHSAFQLASARSQALSRDDVQFGLPLQSGTAASLIVWSGRPACSALYVQPVLFGHARHYQAK